LEFILKPSNSVAIRQHIAVTWSSVSTNLKLAGSDVVLHSLESLTNVLVYSSSYMQLEKH